MVVNGAGSVGRLIISRSDAAMMKRLARNAIPREACGLIVAREVGERVSERSEYVGVVFGRCVPTENVAPVKAIKDYQVDPEAIRDAMRYGKTIVGVWHSHVTEDERMSGSDLAMAVEGLAYVIVSVAHGTVGCWDSEGGAIELVVGGDIGK